MISITSPKENVGKLAILVGLPLFLQLFHIGMTIDNLKEKDNMENKMENTNDRRANYKDSVKKRLTELEIGLRIQDKQIVKTIK